jgi:catechol 2,3-dioxygenase
MDEEPIMDLAHLAHLEVLTPKPDQTLRFFVDVMGMTESGRKGDSVYLRAWDDYERYSLQLTASRTSGLGHAAFRARSPQALQRRVKALEGSGYTVPAIVSGTQMAISLKYITKLNGTRRRPNFVPL